MAAMQPRHDELAWFIDAVDGIDRLLSGAIAALLMCMFAAIGVYIISQLVTIWRRRLRTPGPRRLRATTAIDTWRESAVRMHDIEPRHPPDGSSGA